MGLRDLLLQYGPPLGVTALVSVALLVLAFLGARAGVAPGLWRGVRAHRTTTLLLSLALLVGVGLAVYFEKAAAAEQLRQREQADVISPTNLVADPQFISVGPLTSTLTSWITNRPVSGNDTSGLGRFYLFPGWAITSTMMVVQPGDTYRYSFSADAALNGTGQVRVRMLWLDKALSVLSWNDDIYQVSFVSTGSPPIFKTGGHEAPHASAALQLVLANTAANSEAPTDQALNIYSPAVHSEGVYVEPHPNGAQGSLAFSFDWESAMGGAIHSKGMDPHDPAGAAQHGLEMRQGADWLAKLFADNNVKATFYATGYNLLDGNTERRTFSGDPTYRWAKKGPSLWASDYWLTHKWYGDDPYGTVQSQPAWYFGDQTRTLLKAGHEIAPHTFGHLYVRGSNPQELSTDMGEWLNAAKVVGVPAPTTFAFPWRSSNSLTRDFYDVFYRLGIRAVTRVYEPDLKDGYTIGAVSGITNKQQWEYPDMAVMPDFLLGSPSATMGEENGGGALTADDGLEVISQTLQRRGTTSFWQHPEQLADDPSFAGVRDTWTRVVQAAAHERDNGRLWLATVADITTYQRDVMSVTTSLDSSFFGDWQITVTNNSGKTLTGVTLTLPGDARSATSDDVEVATVTHPDPSKIAVSPANAPVYPARQLVLNNLKPGQSTIKIQWASGQEPVR